MTDTDSPQAGTPTPAAGPAPPGRLVRPRDGRVVGSVAGALAAVLGVDRALVRVGFVVTAFFGGFGVPAYLLMWAALPLEGEADAPVERALRRLGGLHPAVRVLLGVVFVALVLGGPGEGVGPGAAVALILAGVLLLHRDTVAQRSLTAPTATAIPRLPVPPAPATVAGSSPAFRADGTGIPDEAVAAPAPVSEPATTAVPAVPPAPGVPATDALSAAGSGEAVAADSGGSAPPTGPVAGSDAARATLTTPAYGGAWIAPAPPHPVRRPPSALGALTIGCGLLVLGTASVLDVAGLLQPRLEDYLALAVLVIAAGLLVGAVVGRARWLALLGLLLVVPLAVTQAAGDLDLDLSGGVGERTVEVTDPADLEEEYRLGIGSLQLDLSDLELAPGRTAVVEASVGAGELVVRVPPDVTVEGIARIRGGDVRLPDGSRFSGPAERPIRARGDESAGRIELRLDAAFGEIRVDRSR